jgi:hypothetical protein
MSIVGMGWELNIFLTVALNGGEWLATLPGRFTPSGCPQYPLNRWQGESQKVSGYFGEDDISYPCGEMYPYPSVIPHLV